MYWMAIKMPVKNINIYVSYVIIFYIFDIVFKSDR